MSETNALAGSVEPVAPVETVTPAAPVTEANKPAESPPAETPVAETPADANQEPRRSRAQERIEELARENRRLREEQRFRDDLLRSFAPAQPVAAAPDAGKPTLEQFGYDQDKWSSAVTDWAVTRAEAAAVSRVETAMQQRAENARREQAAATFRDSESRYADTVEDYADVVYNPRNSVTPYMASAIMASPIGPQLAYQIAKSGKDREIASLPPELQGRAIALIESQLSQRPAPQVTRAAPPATPVNTATPTNVNPGLRDEMTDGEWIAQRRADLAARRR